MADRESVDWVAQGRFQAQCGDRHLRLPPSAWIPPSRQGCPLLRVHGGHSQDYLKAWHGSVNSVCKKSVAAILYHWICLNASVCMCIVQWKEKVHLGWMMEWCWVARMVSWLSIFPLIRTLQRAVLFDMVPHFLLLLTSCFISSIHFVILEMYVSWDKYNHGHQSCVENSLSKKFQRFIKRFNKDKTFFSSLPLIKEDVWSQISPSCLVEESAGSLDWLDRWCHLRLRWRGALFTGKWRMAGPAWMVLLGW